MVYVYIRTCRQSLDYWQKNVLPIILSPTLVSSLQKIIILTITLSMDISDHVLCAWSTTAESYQCRVGSGLVFQDMGCIVSINVRVDERALYTTIWMAARFGPMGSLMHLSIVCPTSPLPGHGGDLVMG